MADFNKGFNFVLAKEDASYFFSLKTNTLVGIFLSDKGIYAQFMGETSVLCCASFVLWWKYYTEGKLLKQEKKNQLICSSKYRPHHNHRLAFFSAFLRCTEKLKNMVLLHLSLERVIRESKKATVRSNLLAS